DIAVGGRAATHDGRGDCERVRGRFGRLVPFGAGRDRPRAVRRHAGGQFAVAPADMDDVANGQPGTVGALRSQGGPRMTPTSAWRKVLSSAFVWFCAGSVVLAPIPLALVLIDVAA